MGLDAKIRASVDKAFKKIDDILSPVIFTNRAAADFNFTSEEVSTSISALATRGYVMKRKINVDGVRVTRLTLLLKTESYEFNGYTTVSVSGKEYKCSVLESDAYVTTLLIEGI